MKDHTTSSAPERELSCLKVMLAKADRSLIATVRRAAYVIIDSNLSRQLTRGELKRRSKRLSLLPIIDQRRVMILIKDSTPRDQRISAALRDCKYLLSTMMDVNDIQGYLYECSLLGMELANDRRMQLLAALPEAIPAKRST